MDAHEVLGVKKGASKSALKRAYRLLSKKFHPDRNKDYGAEEAFKLAKEAYEYLTTGKSSSGRFYPEPEPVDPKAGWTVDPEPEPKEYYKYEEEIHIPGWQAPQAAFDIHLKLPFHVAFEGGRVRIDGKFPKYPCHIYVQPFMQHGEKHRFVAMDAPIQYDASFEFFDPLEVYKIRLVEEVYRLVRVIKVSLAELILQKEFSFPNLKVGEPPVTVCLSRPYGDVLYNGAKFVIVEGQGAPLPDGKRGPLYVQVNVNYTPLHRESEETLRDIRGQIDNILRVKAQSKTSGYGY